MKYVIPHIAILLVIIGSSSAEGKPTPRTYAIKAGKILTMAPGENEGVINHGIILVSNGKIESLGPRSSIQIPEAYTLIDASDRWVTPGIVEAHTHIGTDGGFNDMVTPINP